MREWMDLEIVEALESCWSDFSPSNMETALSASITLFSGLSDRTAKALSVEPFDGTPVRAEIVRILRRREP